MPAQDGVRPHDDQRRAPVPPGMGEQHPKPSISTAERGTLDGAPEHGQLLPKRQVLEGDRSVSLADQGAGAEHDDDRGQHE